MILFVCYKFELYTGFYFIFIVCLFLFVFLGGFGGLGRVGVFFLFSFSFFFFFCMFQLTENYSVLYKNSLLMPFQSCLK